MSATIDDYAVAIRPRTASSILLWVILASFAALLVWAALATVDRSVHGQGRIVPTSQMQVASNLEGGIVERIMVRAGDHVRAGAPLVQLDRTASGAELGSGEATLGALAAKLARLRAEVTGRRPAFPAADADGAVASERTLYAARQSDLASLVAAGQARVTAAERAVTEAEATLTARQSAQRAADSELRLIRPLVERGIEPRLTLVQQENEAAVAASEAAGAAASLARARANVAEARSTLAQQRQDWRSRAGDELAAAQAEWTSRTRAMPALADRVARTVVRAPVAGRINRVLVTTPGGTVRAGEPIVELVPSEDQLIVETDMSPRDIAFVRIDQPAEIRVTAYDSAIYGTLKGRVVTISPDVTIDQRTGEPHYVVRVRTDARGLRSASGEPLPIGAGMIADVSLLGDRRTILSYLLTPITRLRERAFRE